ncbi:uncharacterized protein FOMMEDRAFT_107554 [Fomitiporia mediterranea MF3/22]|uniref:uncharacterized protein n=1 Tax=Fomitiporia mediterranea (strain MF3/22) TaxID=694068 RepID=UPI00044097BC|nr:uncharacterized protein FOMMEDRAFT_107554 [Fomitiporia mediterranea MF3/22]EJD02622.1 hypothetical protein FOMMEDRAFT_107554 [Fomitiporia mediterranea MF3/22]
MTRTQRASSPRAMRKDRSLSKSGYDKSLRKDGAGRHNWGSVEDEQDLEREALEDAEIDNEELAEVPPDVNAAVRPAVDGPPEATSTSPSSEEDIEKAREFRAKGLKGDVDLASIARTSAGASASPPKAPSLEVTRDADTNAIP